VRAEARAARCGCMPPWGISDIYERLRPGNWRGLGKCPPNCRAS
jgi:hypothetical protein